MTAPYSVLLFDFDHTLFDSDMSEALAYEQTMLEFGLTEPAAHFTTYQRINRKLWDRVESGELTADQVRTERFDQLIQIVGIGADPSAMADTYADRLGANGDLYPGTRPVLEHLASQARLALVTNAISAIQRTRINRLQIADLFETIVISAEVGASKPGQAIFDVAFDRLGHPEKRAALMVGDSLTSDIRGGSDYGIATCWYNPHRYQRDGSTGVTHEIQSHDQISALVGVLASDREPPRLLL